MIRLPAVAGAFYPADKKELVNQINRYFSCTKKVSEKLLKILIVPHAGYDYSGQVAAWGYKQVEEDYKRVILLGVSHRVYFNKAAVFNRGSWQTPLGNVDIDEDFANTLIKQSNFIEANLGIHGDEHSLEVQLPFLQLVLADFKIVPILLSVSSQEDLEELAKSISHHFGNQTLIVISSDLSHYPAYSIAQKVDKETIQSILSGSLIKFNTKIKENLTQPAVETCACGAEAIKVGMIVASRLGIKDIKLLNYSNSGDITEDKSRVVGYASIGFYGDSSNLKSQMSQPKAGPPRAEKPNVKSQNLLNQDQQNQLLKIARITLESYFNNNNNNNNNKTPVIKENDKVLQQKLGAFVTLKTHGQLRGCIGCFNPDKPLYQVVQEKVVDAAINDPRFYPVDVDELKNLSIEISVLSPNIKVDDWKKIKLGTHGVVIKKGSQGGTFLPQVATETGWDLETFLSNLCSHKAGLPANSYKDPKANIYVFTAQVFGE